MTNPKNMGPRATLYLQIYKEFYSRNRPISDRDMKVAIMTVCQAWNAENRIAFASEEQTRRIVSNMADDYLTHFRLYLAAVAITTPDYKGDIVKAICCPDDDCRHHTLLIYQFYESAKKAEAFQEAFFK